MLDFAADYERHGAFSQTNDEVDGTDFFRAFAALKPEQLDELEDDLNFFGFTGVLTPRVLGVLVEMDPSNAFWATALETAAGMRLPEAY